MYELIAAELFNKPHLVSAARLDALSAYVLSRKGFDIEMPSQPKPKAFSGSDTAVYSDNGYYIDGGVAIIEMIGTMVHRAGFMDAASGITSYSVISRRFRRAMKDAEVKSILLLGDTPGGSVSGAFDLSDLIFQARGIKTVYTLAADCLCSAGILIGSSAERVYATQTAQIGSVGVVMKHMDISQWNSDIGVKSTYIYAGERKIDGNPDQPLSGEVLALFQADVEKLYTMFTTTMDRNTDLTQQEVMDTQAAVYLGADAVDVGLAFEVTASEKLLEEMKIEAGNSRSFFTSTTKEESQNMSTVKTDKPAASAENKGGEEQSAAENETLENEEPAASEEDSAVDADAIRADTRKCERERFAAIMTSDPAKGRTASAVHLATKSDMSADDVVATLKDMPAEAKGPSKLDAAMNATGTPGVTAESDDDGEVEASVTILSDYNKALGKKQ